MDNLKILDINIVPGVGGRVCVKVPNVPNKLARIVDHY